MDALRQSLDRVSTGKKKSAKADMTERPWPHRKSAPTRYPLARQHADVRTARPAEASACSSSLASPPGCAG